MTNKEFSQLQDLISKLQNTAEKAHKSNQTFRKYHSSSLELLNKIPDHLNSLIHGLNMIEKSPINKSESQKR